MKEPNDIFRRFSPQAKKILTTSQQVAETMQSGIGSEHILLALAITPQTIAYEILKEYAITLEQIRLILSLNELWTKGGEGLTEDAKTIVTVALRAAAKFQHAHIDAEHLLFAITNLKNSRAYQVIARVGIDPNHLRNQLEDMLGSANDLRMVIEPDLDERETPPHETNAHHHGHGPELLEPLLNPANDREKRPKSKLLPIFTINLTERAKNGLLDPVIGRTLELTRMMQILSRRTKNNPVLIGEPGVGKTALAEGLAQLVSNGNVPASLQGKRILQLDLALLIAGTMYRGQFEERLKRLIEEIIRDQQSIIFIDELHTVVGTGSAEGSMDAANILKPALARGDLRVIGATTFDEYRRFIERDPALERRFQPITIKEPTLEEADAIVDGLKQRYENFHHVRFTDEALRGAVRLAKRYLTDRALPDKAIDLLDEAAAAKRMLEPDTRINRREKLTQKIDQLVKQKERAIEREAFAKAAKLREDEQRVRTKLRHLEKEGEIATLPKIDKSDIASLVAQWTGIPRSHLVHEEKFSLVNLDERISQSLIGQSEAVQQVSQAIQRAGAGIAKSGRPLGSFLFLGPTGVGKTELARVLAREVFGRADAFIKLDMSEFMERHTVARLVGAPAGYVGYDDGGKLTEIVHRQPYALLLLDEFEKAHPDVQHLLLQILEDGSLTDAKGRPINFANTIIILTSNLGSDTLSQAQAIGFQAKTVIERTEAELNYELLAERVMSEVNDFFRPEFLNRLDSLVVFRPLSPESIAKIVDLQLAELSERLTSEHYSLTVSKRARRQLAESGFSPEFGARPVRRLITDWIETPLAQMILRGELIPGGRVFAEPGREQLKLTIQASSRV